MSNQSQSIRIRIGLVGPVGVGKSTLMLGLFMALFGEQNPLFSSPRLSRRLRTMLRRLLGRRVPVDRTSTEVESFSHKWDDSGRLVNLEWVAYPGEAIYRDDDLDADALRQWVAAQQLDFVVFVVNPLELFPKLAQVALANVVLRFLQLGWSLGDSIAHAVNLVFGRNQEGLKDLSAGFAELPEAVRNVCLTRAHRSQNLAWILEKEGVAAADVTEVLRVLELIVEAASANTGEAALLRDLLREMPQMLVAFSHCDLEKWTGLKEADFDPMAATLRAPNRDRRLSDVVFTKQLHLELQGPGRAPVYIRTLLAEGGHELWNAFRPHLSGYQPNHAEPLPVTEWIAEPAAPLTTARLPIRVWSWLTVTPVRTICTASVAAVFSLLLSRAVLGVGYGELFFLLGVIVALAIWASWQRSHVVVEKPKPPVDIPPAIAQRSASALNGVSHSHHAQL
jgi:hypothetical protein